MPYVSVGASLTSLLPGTLHVYIRHVQCEFVNTHACTHVRTQTALSDVCIQHCVQWLQPAHDSVTVY